MQLTHYRLYTRYSKLLYKYINYNVLYRGRNVSTYKKIKMKSKVLKPKLYYTFIVIHENSKFVRDIIYKKNSMVLIRRLGGVKQFSFLESSLNLNNNIALTHEFQ